MRWGFREFLEASELAATELVTKDKTPLGTATGSTGKLQHIVLNLAYRLRNLEKQVAAIRSTSSFSQEEDPSVWVLPR